MNYFNDHKNTHYSKFEYSILVDSSFCSSFYFPILTSTKKSYNYYALVVINLSTGYTSFIAVCNCSLDSFSLNIYLCTN